MIRSLIVLGVFLFVFSASTTAYACRCKMPTTTWSYKKAEMVLVVKAERVENLGDEVQSVDVSVSEAWKQNVSSSLKILAGGKVCGYFFEAGKEYVVYLKKNENGEWTTENCVGNKVTNDDKLPLIAQLAVQDKKWLKKNGKKAVVE